MQRAHMLDLAVAGSHGLIVDRRELERQGRSYSIDTLRDLRAELGPAQPLALLIGADSFTMEDVITLKGVFNAIREGNVKVEEAFVAGTDLPVANSEVLKPQQTEPEIGKAEVVESTPAAPEEAPY